MAMAGIVKGLPSGYSRDLQDMKPQLFESSATSLATLKMMNGVVRSLQLNKERMQAGCASQDYAISFDVAEQLVLKNKIPFREAHKIVGVLVHSAASKGIPLNELTIEDIGKVPGALKFTMQAKTRAAAIRGMTPEKSIQTRRSKGSPNQTEQEEMIKSLSQNVSNYKQGIHGLVAESQDVALSAPEAPDSAPPLPGAGAPDDWDAPVPDTSVQAFLEVAGSLAARGFSGADQLYGFARHEVETTFLATSNGLRRRHSQPTGSVEINGKRDDASAWVGYSTPDFVDVPTDSLLERLSTRLGWAQRTVELPAGRYETIMPPSTVADMMIYLWWTIDGRGAEEGRTALSAPGDGTRVGRSSPICR